MKSPFRYITLAAMLAIIAPWALSQQPAQRSAQQSAQRPGQPPQRPGQPPQRPGQPGAPANGEEEDTKKTKLSNGVEIEILVETEGPKPAPNAIVQVQYIGMLEDGTEFANSYADAKPPIFRLKEKIGCLRSAIPHMTLGSKVKVTCPPGSANGPRQVDMIRADTKLYFELELLNILEY